MDILVIIAIVLGAILLGFWILIWVRKLQFDVIHRNLLELEDAFGGKVSRGGLASRPRYSGTYKGNKVSVSFSYESKQKSKQYYLAVTMQCRSPVQFTVLSRNWLAEQADAHQEGKTIKAVAGGDYLVEVSKSHLMKKIPFKKIDPIIRKLDPFAYILVAKTGMIMERVSDHLVKDTQFAVIRDIFEHLYQLQQVLEGKGRK